MLRNKASYALNIYTCISTGKKSSLYAPKKNTSKGGKIRNSLLRREIPLQYHLNIQSGSDN